MSEMVPTEAEVVAELARRVATPMVLDTDAKYLLTHEAQRVLDMEKFLDAPRRATGAFMFTQAHSLEQYVLEHMANGACEPAAFASVQNRSMIVVMNEHDAGQPGWGDWRATLSLQSSLAWDRWRSYDGQFLEQEDFAEHIEDGLLEIVTPSGARMLEIAQSFHATLRAAVDSATRLDNGETQLSYVEQVTARAGQKKQIAVPAFFDLGLPPFEGGAAFKLRARFRYRLRDGQLRLGYKLERPEDVLRGAFDEIVNAFSETTRVPLFYGTPRTLR